MPPADPNPEVLRLVRQILTQLAPGRHSIDFASVRWGGELYGFSPTQARVVRLLWEAWENGVPDIHQATLLDRAGSECRQLRSLFKGHPAWGTLIVASPLVKGAYRLNDMATDRKG
jgi:hypothetical protein